MTTAPDLSTASAQDCIALIEAANKRLEEIKERFLQEAALVGLSLAENGKKPKRRNSKHDAS